MYETSKVGLYAERTDVSKPTWAENLRLFITTANLRGIPYSLEQFGAANDDFNEFRMKRHRDWIGFDTSESSFQGLHHLDLHSSRAPTEKGNNAWDLLRVAASATAALPLFFPAVRIALSTDLYTCRIAGECPDWPEGMPSTYEYDAVDGGVFHNEPLGLVRDSIEHDHPGALDQNSKLTKGAVILLHPSPPRDSYDVNPETKSCNMLSILGRVLGALINEANFKEHELKEISDVENISRFMIAPVRKGRKSRQPVLATDTMKGFGGIIHKDVRHHDFQLGRSNCKQFLQNHFVITPEMALNNPIFGKEALEFVTKVDDGKREVIPIIPLYGTAATDFEEPTWPSFNEKRRAELETDLHNIIDLRIGLIFKCFAHNMGFYKYNGPFNFGFQSMWNATVDKILHMSKEKVMSSVDEETKNALTQFL